MKQVKKKFLYIGLIIVILITLSGCSKLGYKEDTIYSENIFEDYANDDIKGNKENYINREEALDKAFNILKNVLRVDIDRQLLNESIKIVKFSDEFAWQISFTQEQNKKIIINYYICMDMENGDVREIIFSNGKQDPYFTQNMEKYSKKSNVSDEEIENIMKPLCRVLNIKIEDYTKTIDYNLNNVVVKLYEKDKKSEKFSISIDTISKKTNLFYMN